jgi:uncharacterized protein (DUF433 family)
MPDLDVAPIGQYTAAEVARLAGVSPRRIGQWARRGIIVPSVSRRPNVYSYADAGEAVLAHYLVDQGIRPRGVLKIVTALREQYGTWPLVTAPLKHDGTLVIVEHQDGSYDVLSHDVQADQKVLSRRLLNLKDIRQALSGGGWVAYRNPRSHIEVDPDRHSGDPVIRGRRITTSRVAALAELPDGRQTLKDDFGLTDDEIDDAVGYEQDLTAIAA